MATEGIGGALDGVVALAGLFVSAFIAATILPAQSEVVLVALLAAGKHSPWLLVTVASIGNVLGAVVNWLLGRGINRYRDRSWFPASPKQLDRAIAWYGKWGRWSLLLSWLPIGGDALTVVAGALREPLWSFLMLVTCAKVLRYVVLAVISLQIVR